MFLMRALGFSLLVHGMLLLSVMSIDLPKERTRSDFEAWVKELAPTPRRATLLPKALQTAVKTSQKVAATGNAAGVAVAAAPAGRTKTVRTSGVLRLIGVASERGGDFGNVFSAGSRNVSDDLSSVMEGKKHVGLPAGSHISRQALKGSGSVGPADMGGIASVSSGKVESGHRKEKEVPASRVMASASKVVAGMLEQPSVLGVIMRKNSSFTRCYERVLKNNSNLAGRLGYEISVGEEGQVMDVKFIEDMLRSPDVSDCIKGILMRLVFPKPKGGPAIFSSVLVFGTV